MDTRRRCPEKPWRKAASAVLAERLLRRCVASPIESDGDEAREILRDIDLEVKRGEVLAIVGSSGAGKSTLVHLIPRFFDVTGGRMLIDGHDVRDVTLASLRAQVGIVTQETVLFNDTVRNNIAYGQPHVSQKEVEAAARAALAHDFILELPAGLRYGDRRARRAAFRRRASASRHCSRPAEECADPDSRRGHFSARQRIGIAGAVGAAESDERPHRLRHRASALDGAPCRSHRCDREWHASPTSVRMKS